MNKDLTKWTTIVIVGALLFAITAFFTTQKREVLPVEEPKLKVLGDLKPAKDEEKSKGKVLTFSYRGDAAHVEVIATEPGMYPAKSIESDNEGRVPLRFFDNFKSEFEFLVRQTDDTENRGAFWGPWQSTVSDTFRLKPATDLVIKFTNSEGEGIAGTKLRLGRDSVSLLWLEGVTDESGEAQFHTLPPGRYVVSATHQGNTSERAFVHHSSQRQITFANTASHTLKGIVKNEAGKPIPDAVVECYIAGQDYAADIVTTDLFGQFSTDIKGTSGEVVIRHSRFVTKYGVFETEKKIEIILKKGNTIAVSVRDDSEKGVSGALVSWFEKESPDRIGEARTSDDRGEVTFKGVPTGAVFNAFLGGFKSPDVVAQDSDKNLTLVLSASNDLQRRIRFRVEKPKGVQISSILATQSNASCKLNSTSDRDFEIVGCPEGEFELRVKTNRGNRVVSANLKDGSTVKLGSTQPVRIRFKGISNERWGQTKINLDKRLIQMDLLSESTAEWTGELFPGRYQVFIRNDRVGELPFTIDSTKESEFDLVLKGPKTKKFWVVDTQESPVTNAYMMLWKGDTLIDVASSSGQLPTEFRDVDFSGFSLIAIDPQRGEGGGKVEGLAERITLSKPIGTLSIPAKRVDKEKLKHELGISFAKKDRGFLINVEPGSLAEQIGVRDGDFWVSAYFDVSERIQLIVYRKGKFQVTSFDSVLEAK